MTRETIAFTNEIGQVINPGDDVVVVTTCTGNTQTAKGKYLGMRGKYVQAEVPRIKTAWFVKGTDQLSPPNFTEELYNSGFRWGSPEFSALRDKVYAPYELRTIEDTRITTLYYNRIFKLAM